MRAFQKDLLKFESLNAQVLGVSADDIETHKRFSTELGLKFPLISDRDRTQKVRITDRNQASRFNR
jgi:peroxiredoxin